jgi:hypothetical protein
MEEIRITTKHPHVPGVYLSYIFTCDGFSKCSRCPIKFRCSTSDSSNQFEVSNDLALKMYVFTGQDSGVFREYLKER